MKKAIIETIGGSEQITVIDQDGHTSIPLTYFKASGDLLAAAKMAFRRILPGDPLNPEMDPEHVALRDAIAKAEGRK